MNDKIKERVQAILCNYGLDDDWFFPIAQENTKTGNVAEMDIRASKAYQYLLDHAKEITFTEFEEVFFVLITTAYEYERNIETPALQLLSDEVLHRTDAVFSQDKRDYLYQIQELMKKQFNAFLYFRDSVPKTKARILPLFTFSFDTSYWNMIKADAEKALTCCPDGEIANRLVCISDTAAQYDKNKYLNNNKKEEDYPNLKKYLNHPRKDFLSDCFIDFYVEMPQPDFPLIRPNYDLNDHDDLVNNLDIYNNEVYQEVKNNYLLRVLRHALVNPVIISFWGHNNPITWATKLSEKEVKELNDKLNQKNEELRQAQEDRARVINDFSHTYSNMLATSLYYIAQELLSSDNETMKRNGRKLLLEYENKMRTTMAVEMLRMQFEEKNEQLKKYIIESMGDSDTGIPVSELFHEALQRCIITLLLDGSTKGEFLRFAFEMEEPDRKSLLDKFETEITSGEQDILKWTQHNIMPVYFDNSDTWKTIYFNKDGYAASLVISIFSEFVRNIFKYADKTKEITFVLAETESKLMITAQNTIKEDYEVEPNGGAGLQSKNTFLKHLDKQNMVSYTHTEKEFSVTAEIVKSLFIR